MNTTPLLESAPAPRHDCEIATDELQTLFASLQLTSTVTGAHAAIDESKKGADGKGWAHVAVIVTFTHSRENNGHGRRIGNDAFSTSFPWKMGTGLVNWKAIAKSTPTFKTAQKNGAESMAAHGTRLTEATQRAIAEDHLEAFVRAVKPAEVLACVCADGLDTEGQSFNSWAENYGYSPDSRKAETIYRACQENGVKARNLLAHAPGAFVQLAKLSERL